MDNFDFFGPNLPKNGFRFWNSENLCWKENQHPWDIMSANFQAKRTTSTFSVQIYLKLDFWLEIQKTNAGIRISILEIPCVPSFRQKRQFCLFQSKFTQKWILGSEVWIQNQCLQYTLCANFQSKWTTLNFSAWMWGNCPIRYDILVLITLRVFQRAGWRLKWAGWRWMELGGGGWSRVEVGARFSNTPINR